MNQQQKKLALARITSIMLRKLTAVKEEESAFISNNLKLRNNTAEEIIAMISDGTLQLRKVPKEHKNNGSNYFNITIIYDFDKLVENKSNYAQSLGIIMDRYGSFKKTSIKLINPLEKNVYYRENTLSFVHPKFLKRGLNIAKDYQEHLDTITFGTDSEIIEIIKSLEAKSY